MTSTFIPRRAMVMTHTNSKVQRSVDSKDRAETNKRTDRRTLLIDVTSWLTRSVIGMVVLSCTVSIRPTWTLPRCQFVQSARSFKISEWCRAGCICLEVHDDVTCSIAGDIKDSDQKICWFSIAYVISFFDPGWTVRFWAVYCYRCGSRDLRLTLS